MSAIECYQMSHEGTAMYVARETRETTDAEFRILWIDQVRNHWLTDTANTYAEAVAILRAWMVDPSTDLIEPGGDFTVQDLEEAMPEPPDRREGFFQTMEAAGADGQVLRHMAAEGERALGQARPRP